MREFVRLQQQFVGAAGLDRVQVGALQVLAGGELEPVAHVLPDDGGDRGLSRRARGDDAAVSGDELVALALLRYHYRLQDTMPADRRGEFFDSRRNRVWARLLRGRRDPGQRDLGPRTR